MKSAYELALERSGSTLRSYTDDQKQKMAKIDRAYDVKVAKAKFEGEERAKDAADDPDMARQIMNDLEVEIASIERRREREKDEIRNS